VAQPSYPGPTSLEGRLDRLRQSLQDEDESKVREQLLAMASTDLSLMESEMQVIDLRDDLAVGLTPSSGSESTQSST